MASIGTSSPPDLRFPVMHQASSRWIRRAVALLVVVAGLPGTVSSRPAAPHLDRVSFAPRQDGLGHVVRLHVSGPINAYSAPDANGEVVEMVLFNTRLGSGCRFDPAQGPIASYEAMERGSHVYLRFRLDPAIPVRVEAYRDRGTADLLVTFTRHDAPAPPVARHDPPRHDPPVVPVRTAAAPSRAATPGDAMRSAQTRWTLDTVVIDAGHGGHDPGTIGVGGVREKDVVLAVARKLGHYLEELLGLRVVYTRSDDRFIDLKDRGRMANEAGGKLFISIHANAARSRSARGAEVFFLGMHKTDAARKVMERENSVIQYESNPDHYASLDRQSLVLQTLAQSAYMRKSEELADLIMTQFAERVHRETRGVKQAGFYVLFGASMPAVLVELGFLSNPEEAAFLRSEEGQTYMASAIFRAVRDFKEKYDRDLHLANQD